MTTSNTTCMTGGAAVIATLAEQGVDRVFGVPGGHSIAIFHALAQQDRVRLVLGRHEQGLAFMADGYSRAGGRIGVVTTTSGPGVANMAAALGGVTTDTSSVLAISSTVHADLVGANRGALHDLNASFDIMRPVCRYVRRCDSVADIPVAIAGLIDDLRNRRPGAAYCEIPHNLLSAEAPVAIPARVERVPARPDAHAVSEAARVLAGAERPLIWAGTGAMLSDAGPAIGRLAAALGAVVTTTALGRGVLPADHPNVVTRNPIDGKELDVLIDAADAVLAVGTMFKEEDTSKWKVTFGGTLIHVDIDAAEMGRSYAADIPIVADARATLEALLAALPARPPADPSWLARAGAAEEAMLADLRRIGPVEMQALDVLRAAVPRDAVLVCDRCSLGYWAHRRLPVYAPRTFQYPLGYGGLGGALPQAIGARLACPDRPVVCVIGDGGFQYTAPELVMAVQEKVPITIVLCNNHAYGAIAAAMTRTYGRAMIGCALTNPDFRKLAAAYGAAAVRADTLDGFRDALVAGIRSDALNLIELTIDIADPP